MPQPKYPQIKVKLVGEDGNALFILGRVQGAMRKAGLTREQIKEFMDEATSGDYNKLLRTVMEYVDADGEQAEEEE